MPVAGMRQSLASTDKGAQHARQMAAKMADCCGGERHPNDVTFVWRGGSLDLTDAPTFAQDGNSSGSGSDAGGDSSAGGDSAGGGSTAGGCTSGGSTARRGSGIP